MTSGLSTKVDPAPIITPAASVTIRRSNAQLLSKFHDQPSTRVPVKGEVKRMPIRPAPPMHRSIVLGKSNEIGSPIIAADQAGIFGAVSTETGDSRIAGV
jgi:hypothetical protein